MGDEVSTALQRFPHKTWSQTIPTDPVIYRWDEIVGVYGETILVRQRVERDDDNSGLGFAYMDGCSLNICVSESALFRVNQVRSSTGCARRRSFASA